VILSFGAFERVKLYKARHPVEMTVARQPDVLESSFGPFGDAMRIITQALFEYPSAL
jgi:hypothetical protein